MKWKYLPLPTNSTKIHEMRWMFLDVESLCGTISVIKVIIISIICTGRIKPPGLVIKPPYFFFSNLPIWIQSDASKSPPCRNGHMFSVSKSLFLSMSFKGVFLGTFLALHENESPQKFFLNQKLISTFISFSFQWQDHSSYNCWSWCREVHIRIMIDFVCNFLRSCFRFL